MAAGVPVIPTNISDFGTGKQFHTWLQNRDNDQLILTCNGDDDSHEALSQRVMRFFRQYCVETHTPEENSLIDPHWGEITQLAFKNADRPAPHTFTSVSRTRDIFDQFLLTLAHVDVTGFSPYPNKQTDPESFFDASNLVKYLLHNIPLNCDLLKLSHFQYAVSDEFISESLRRPRRQELEKLLRYVYSSVSWQSRTDLVARMFVGQILTLYAFMGYPRDGDTVSIPILVNGRDAEAEWRQVAYKIELVPLNPGWMGEVIHAVGLTTAEKGMPALLLFRATRGTLACMADMTPGFSAGRSLYYFAKEKISAFISKARNVNSDHPVQIYGTSLGGALAYYTAQDHPNDVEIHAFAPPGSFIQEECNIRGEVFLDPTDIVSMLGHHPVSDRLNVYRVIRPDPTHMRLFGGEQTLLIKTKAVYENYQTSRTLLSLAHQLISVPVFVILTAILAISTFVRKICEFASSLLSYCCGEEPVHPLVH